MFLPIATVSYLSPRFPMHDFLSAGLFIQGIDRPVRLYTTARDVYFSDVTLLTSIESASSPYAVSLNWTVKVDGDTASNDQLVSCIVSPKLAMYLILWRKTHGFVHAPHILIYTQTHAHILSLTVVLMIHTWHHLLVHVVIEIKCVLVRKGNNKLFWCVKEIIISFGA